MGNNAYQMKSGAILLRRGSLGLDGNAGQFHTYLRTAGFLTDMISVDDIQTNYLGVERVHQFAYKGVSKNKQEIVADLIRDHERAWKMLTPAMQESGDDDLIIASILAQAGFRMDDPTTWDEGLYPTPVDENTTAGAPEPTPAEAAYTEALQNRAWAAADLDEAYLEEEEAQAVWALQQGQEDNHDDLGPEGWVVDAKRKLADADKAVDDAKAALDVEAAALAGIPSGAVNGMNRNTVLGYTSYERGNITQDLNRVLTAKGATLRDVLESGTHVEKTVTVEHGKLPEHFLLLHPKRGGGEPFQLGVSAATFTALNVNDDRDDWTQAAHASLAAQTVVEQLSRQIRNTPSMTAKLAMRDELAQAREVAAAAQEKFQELDRQRLATANG